MAYNLMTPTPVRTRLRDASKTLLPHGAVESTRLISRVCKRATPTPRKQKQQNQQPRRHRKQQQRYCGKEAHITSNSSFWVNPKSRLGFDIPNTITIRVWQYAVHRKSELKKTLKKCLQILYVRQCPYITTWANQLPCCKKYWN